MMQKPARSGRLLSEPVEARLRRHLFGAPLLEPSRLPQPHPRVPRCPDACLGIYLYCFISWEFLGAQAGRCTGVLSAIPFGINFLVALIY